MLFCTQVVYCTIICMFMIQLLVAMFAFLISGVFALQTVSKWIISNSQNIIYLNLQHTFGDAL